MYIRRAIEPQIAEANQSFPVLLVVGPKKSGKTTMLKRLSDGRAYVSLNDLDERFLAQNDPVLFLQRHCPPVIIDDIQYAPQLLPHIKDVIESASHSGDYWLASSHDYSESAQKILSGQVKIVKLLGLSAAEIYYYPSEPFIPYPKNLRNRSADNPRTLQEVYMDILKGGMPAVHSGETIDTESYYESYINEFLLQEAKGVAKVADTMRFYRFMVAVAANTSKPIVHEEIAKEIGVSATTSKRWLTLLIESGMVMMIHPLRDKHLKRALLRKPIVHYLDMGLCAFLLKWSDSETLERGPMSEAFFKSYAFTEIYKSHLNAGYEPMFNYYRNKERDQIDLLLIEEDDTILPISFCKSLPLGHTLKDFELLAPTAKVGPGAVISSAPMLQEINKTNWCVPIWMI